MRTFVFLFPGQGSQYVGMGKTLFEHHGSVQRLFEEASDVTKRDLKRLCFEGPEPELVRTDNAQPAITVVNLACLTALQEEQVSPTITAGHSLGEYSALCAAGVFSVAETMRLVAIRGEAMNEAAQRHPGGMAAVFGLDMEALTAICDDVKDLGSVEVANQNSPLQLVLTGEKPALQRASELAKKKGAKLVVPLKVAGPWHSRFMSDAKERMRATLMQSTIASPTIRVIANVTAAAYPGDREHIINHLVDQLVSPVLWAASMRTLVDEGAHAFVEVGPGKVLAGLMRDVSREVKVLNVQDEGTLLAFRITNATPSE